VGSIEDLDMADFPDTKINYSESDRKNIHECLSFSSSTFLIRAPPRASGYPQHTFGTMLSTEPQTAGHPPIAKEATADLQIRISTQ
ncbi:hypothetical protein AVEN_129882-1, partial [Araneus ventricosus]